MIPEANEPMPVARGMSDGGIAPAAKIWFAIEGDKGNAETGAIGMRALSSILTLASGRRAKWLVLLFWVVVAALVAPFASKLTAVEKNDAASFLPGSAESTKVNELLQQFPAGQTVSAVVVYYRESGLTPADSAKATADREAFIAAKLPRALPPTPVTPAQDGKGILYIVPFQSGPESDQLANAVKGLRKITGEGDNGLNIKVTGQAGFVVDSIGIFSNINTRLLLTTVLIVTVLLLLTYRSPFLWLFPLISVGLVSQVTQGVVYGAAKNGIITVNGQSTGILTVLIFGAGTDYALLLIARYREELRRHEDRHEAMAFALRQGGPAILASGATVTISLLCLLVAELNSTRGLGPVSAIGIVLTLAAMLTLLPALLVIVGRGVFWPFIPRFGSPPQEESGLWAHVGAWIARRPRTVWIGTTVALAIMALGLFTLNTNLSQNDSFRGSVDSVAGQKLLAKSFPSGSSAPAIVIVQPAANVDAARNAIANSPDVAAVTPVDRAGDYGRFSVTLKADPASGDAFDAIDQLRAQVRTAAGPGARVGGTSAVNLDVKRASLHDRKIILPLVLFIVLVILGLLLRAIIAPILLMLTVIVSLAASLGVSALVFDHLYHFGGEDASLPLFAFIFLVALGIDYNIFLMARVREESEHLGTRRGMLKGLAVTGGVITSAGVVLAATFAVLATLPLVALTEIGFVVAFGVLLDTLIVRSILVPALTLDVGARMWWPSALANAERDRHTADAEERVRVG